MSLGPNLPTPKRVSLGSSSWVLIITVALYSPSEGSLLSCLAIILQYNAGSVASNIGRGQIPEGLVLLSPDDKVSVVG